MKTMKDETLEALDAEVTRRVQSGESISSLLGEIEFETGVRFEWLQKFRNRRIPNPGVNFVQAVHDWLIARREADARKARRRAA
jgi:hypothetical protein